MSTELKDTGVTAWLESDTAVRAQPPLHPTSTHGHLVIGMGTASLALFIDDPAACYRLAGAAVTLAKSLEAKRRAEVGTDPRANTAGDRLRDRVASGLELLTPSDEVTA